ncbi:hypothetical protein Droror1_Dr00010114 [Drosera rotundifolia]
MKNKMKVSFSQVAVVLIAASPHSGAGKCVPTFLKLTDECYYFAKNCFIAYQINHDHKSSSLMDFRESYLLRYHVDAVIPVMRPYTDQMKLDHIGPVMARSQRGQIMVHSFIAPTWVQIFRGPKCLFNPFLANNKPMCCIMREISDVLSFHMFDVLFR